jgi:DNA polymerase-3 subunit delta'
LLPLQKMANRLFIGQESAWGRLTQLIDEGRVPQALLFTGPEGAGKFALALAFAQELLSHDAHNQQNVQAMLEHMDHPDLHFSYPTIKLSSMGSEHQPVSSDFNKEWRQMLTSGPYFTMDYWMKLMGAANQQSIITGAESDELAHKLSLKSSQGGYKVAIIWLPEKMNLTSANKILKLLEEPPQQTVFLMVSEHPELLLETIRSRTQRFDVKRISDEDIESALIQQRAIEPDMAHRVARVAHGNWNRALEVLDTGNENRQFHDMFVMLMRLAYQRNVKDLKKWSETVATFGREKQRRMLEYFLCQVRENFMYNFHDPDLVYMTQEEENFSKNFARFINEANVIGISELMQRCHRDIGQNANAKIVFYDMALKMIVLILAK